MEPITGAQERRITEETEEVAKRLRDILNMPERKDMIKNLQIASTRAAELFLGKNGFFILWHDICVLPSDCDGNHNDWTEGVSPNAKLVRSFKLALKDVEQIIRRLKK